LARRAMGSLSAFMNQPRRPSRCRQAHRRSALPSRVCSFFGSRPHSVRHLWSPGTGGPSASRPPRPSTPQRRSDRFVPQRAHGCSSRQRHRCRRKRFRPARVTAARPNPGDVRRTFRYTDQLRIATLSGHSERCSGRSRVRLGRLGGCGRWSCLQTDVRATRCL
jgi:hypothetical protein